MRVLGPRQGWYHGTVGDEKDRIAGADRIEGRAGTIVRVNEILIDGVELQELGKRDHAWQGPVLKHLYGQDFSSLEPAGAIAPLALAGKFNLE